MDTSLIPECDLQKDKNFKELLVLAECLHAFKFCLLGQKVTKRSDSRPVSFYNRAVNRTPRIERILSNITEYDFDLQLISSRKNLGDALSRYVDNTKDPYAI